MERDSKHLDQRPRGMRAEVEDRAATRVVITGMGVITPLGLNVPDFWKNLVAGRSGISSVEFPYTSVKVAGVVHDFNPEVSLSGLVHQKNIKKLSRPVQFAIAAAYEAFLDGGLLDEQKHMLENVDLTRFGTVIGTGIGGAVSIIESDEKLAQGQSVKPSDLFRSEPERVASAVSMTFGLKGSLEAPSAACATGNIAASNGLKEILLGNADLMVVGGSEACLHGVTLSLFESAHALSLQTDPVTASKPFNKKRDGFVMSEGAGIYILESLDHALKRGAKIYAELVGYGNTADAGHDTVPSEEGQRRAINLAMRNVKNPDGHTIYINAHGTSTPPGDPVEISAIRKELEGRDIAVSSSKSEIGHTVGAAGAIEAIVCMEALNEGILPPTINITDPIEEAEGLNLVPNEAQLVEGVEVVLNTSFGFGGINSVLAFQVFRE